MSLALCVFPTIFLFNRWKGRKDAEVHVLFLREKGNVLCSGYTALASFGRRAGRCSCPVRREEFLGM